MLTDDLLIYTDCSKGPRGAVVSGVAYKRGAEIDRGGCAVPDVWLIVRCEMFALILALQR